MNPYRNSNDPGDPTPPPRWYRRRVPNWVSSIVIGLAVLAGGVQAATPALRLNGLKFGANDVDVYATVYGAVGDDATDNTTAFQNAVNAATAANARLVIPAGIYRVGLVTDTSAGRLEIVGTAGTIIKTTASTWLKVAPTAGKTAGVTLNTFTVTPLSGYAAMTPLIWLEGASTGGIISVNIKNIKFNGGGSYTSPIAFDCMWLRGVFNGSVSNIYGDSLWGSRGIVYEANGINSGNVHFDSITLADAAVEMQIDGAGGVAGAGTTLALHNQILLSNVKAVRGAQSGDAGPYDELTLTAVANAGDTTVTVSGADATIVNNHITAKDPQWLVAADATRFDGAYRITAANTGTGVLTLASGLRYGMANSSVVADGSFGVIVGGNARGVQINDQHCEQVGGCVYGSGCQQVEVTNAIVASNLKRGLVATNGAQGMKLMYPIFGASGSLTMMEVTTQGTNAHNTLVGPAAVGGGSPAAYLADANAAGNSLDNRYFPKETQFEFDNLTTGTVAGLQLQNTTASTVGVPVQSSPCLEWDGTAWNTTAVASQSSNWFACSVPTSGASITAQLLFYSVINGGAPTLRFYTNSAGALVSTGALLAGSTGAGTVQAANLEPGAATAQTIGTSANSTSITEGRAGGSYTNNSPASFTSTFSTAAVGPNSSQQHTLPAVASDVVTLNAATQTLTNKTFSSDTFSGGTFSGTIAGTPTLSGGFVASGSVAFQSAVRPHRITVADVNYTALVSDGFIAYTSISAARVISISCTGLGSSSSPQILMVKDEAGTASGTNTITITPTTGTIDGGASVVCVNAAKGSCRIYSNGANCFTW